MTPSERNEGIRDVVGIGKGQRSRHERSALPVILAVALILVVPGALDIYSDAVVSTTVVHLLNLVRDGFDIAADHRIRVGTDLSSLECREFVIEIHVGDDASIFGPCALGDVGGCTAHTRVELVGSGELARGVRVGVVVSAWVVLRSMTDTALAETENHATSLGKMEMIRRWDSLKGNERTRILGKMTDIGMRRADMVLLGYKG